MQTKTLKLILLSLLLSVLISAVYICKCFETIRIDGFSGEVLSFLCRTDTKYAPGYSHAGFNSIKEGMTEDEVIEILGEPLVRRNMNIYSSDCQNHIAFQYSESPSSTNYRYRQVYFCDGIVVKIAGHFYID